MITTLQPSLREVRYFSPPLKQALTRHEHTIATLATWVGAPFLVPVIRYTQDKPEERRRLFIRDFSSLSLGACLYFAASLFTKKLLNKSKAFENHPAEKRLLSLGAGLAANVMFTSFFAVKLSQWLDNKLKKHVPQPNTLSSPIFLLQRQGETSTSGTKNPSMAWTSHSSSTGTFFPKGFMESTSQKFNRQA
jgi:hypothetical protein